MATVLQLLAGLPVSQGAGTTTYGSLVGGSKLTFSSTEGFKQITYRTAGVLSNIYIRILTNDRAASTMTSRDNATAGNQSVSITGSTTGDFEDTSNTDTVSAGDEYAFRLVMGAGGTTFTVGLASCLFAATTNTVQLLNVDVNGTVIGANASDRFSNVVGDAGISTTEANNKIEFNTSGTLKNGAVNISANTRSVDILINSRVAGADGNLLLTITASTTGVFEDTSNTDAVTAGQDVDWVVQADGSGSGSATTRSLKVEFETTDDSTVFGLGAGAAEAMTATTTYYLPVAGNLLNNWPTESEVMADANAAFTASKLWAILSANTVSADSNLRFRINGNNGNQNVVLTASTTGEFEDSSNTDAVVATDEINHSVVCGATGTSLAIRGISMTADYTAAGASLIKTIDGLAQASVKTVFDLAIASVKTVNGLANT